MNIFVTDKCPFKSAEYLDDKRVVKMVTESAQMLSTAITVNGGEGPYKISHLNHPCTVWARQTQGNYMWLFLHFVGLYSEYTNRYGKTHKCEQYTNIFLDNILLIPEGNQTPFANCAARKDLDICYKHIDDTCEAYRLYLDHRWKIDKHKPTWRNR